MERLRITEKDKAQKMIDDLYYRLNHRIGAAPEGNCPIELAGTFLRLCLAQSCGKCVPCRIGIERLVALVDELLNGEGSEETLETMEQTAQAITESADCAIGFEAGNWLLEGFSTIYEDYMSHQKKGRCLASAKSVPCVSSCPAHVDVPGYIALIEEGRYEDAIRLIRKDNPFPAACGLVCEHPCEDRCRRKLVDAPINIRGLKRFAVDQAGGVPVPERRPDSGKSVAVVGGGPSGLTAAYYLSLMGHKVTVFEKRGQLGGMLRYGIPRYRLPEDYLMRDIASILSTGIEIKLGMSIGTDITIAQLKEDYDSVYLSIGAHTDKKLGIEGEDKRGVYSAVELLANMGEDNPPDLAGRHVLVVGGGNVAMDASRTALRLGAASVSCVYRRRREDMTAMEEEIEGAVAEGCELLTLKVPVRISYDAGGKVNGLVVQQQVIGEVEGKRPKPYNAAVPEETLACDVIVVAIGQAVDSAVLAEQGVPTARRDNSIIADDNTIVHNDGVFSGGDCVTGPATVIRAIEYGKVAAANIDRYLGYHNDISTLVEVSPPTPRARKAAGRITMAERKAGERKGDFDLLEQRMTEEEGKQECSRCLRCDHFGRGSHRGGRENKW